MTRAHKKFEMLCALAAIERLSEKDLQELTDHCLSCKGCQRRLIETEAVSQEYFLLYTARAEKTAALPPGAHDRFLRRASALGIPLSSRNSMDRLVPLPIAVFVVAIIALFLGRILTTSNDLPRDTHPNISSNAKSISPAPLHLTTADAPASVSVNIPDKHERTTERPVPRMSRAKYRTKFQFSPQLRLTRAITIAKEPLVFKLSPPANWDISHPVPVKTFALTSLPQLWPNDDPAPRDKHIAHFDLPALFPKSINKTQ